MDFVGKCSLRSIEQLQIRLMNQSCRLECVIWAFAGEMPQSNPMQLVIQSRCQLVQCGGVIHGGNLSPRSSACEFCLSISLHISRLKIKIDRIEYDETRTTHHWSGCDSFDSSVPC